MSAGDPALDGDCLWPTADALGVHVGVIVRDLFRVEMADMVGGEIPDIPLLLAFCRLFAGLAGDGCG